MSDLETRSTLIERVRNPNDSESWREFVELYEPLLMKFVLSQGTPPSEAQDIVQEVFTALLQALPAFNLDKDRGRFRSWLWLVSRNIIVDWARRNGRRKKATQQWHERLATLNDDHDSEEQWCAAHKRRVLEFALERVQRSSQPKTWACFEEHIRQGRRAADLAEELNLSPNAIYVNASRVLKRVRSLCAEYGESLEDE